jgi:acyl dehydratase
VKEGLKGQTLFEVQRTIDEPKLGELATALDSATAAETATLVPFFGPTVPGEALFVDLLGLDLTRALLAGISYSFARPFQAGESVTIKVSVEDFYEKSGMQFVVVLTEATDAAGELVHAHKATFIERGAA